MGAFSSTEACELPDLSINMDLEENAKTPTFETPGRGGLTLYALEEVRFEPDTLTKVPTGVTPRLPFMLVGMVVPLPIPGGLNVQTQVVDYDSSDPIVVEVLNPSPGFDSATICAGCPIAMLVILPIARPGLRVSRPARDDDEAVVRKQPADDADGSDGVP